jgi:hypothetical protein
MESTAFTPSSAPGSKFIPLASQVQKQRSPKMFKSINQSINQSLFPNRQKTPANRKQNNLPILLRGE